MDIITMITASPSNASLPTTLPDTTSPITTTLTTSSTASSPDPESDSTLTYIAIGIVLFVLVLILSITAIVVGMVCFYWKRKQRLRQQFRSSSFQPVQYKPKSLETADSRTTVLETQPSINVTSNAAYDSAHNVPAEGDGTEMYEDMSGKRESMELYEDMTGSHENLEMYEDMTGSHLSPDALYEEITKENVEEDAYVSNVSDFLPGGKQREHFSSIDELLKEEEKEDLGSPSTRRKNNPHYINDLDEVTRQMEKEGVASKEDPVSDEDDEGYTMFDPRQTTNRGRGPNPGISSVSSSTKLIQEEIHYQNNSVMQRDAEKALKSPLMEKAKKPETGSSNPEPVDSRPYVNDLNQALAEAQQREVGGGGAATGKRRNHYVNDITGMLEAALKEQEREKEREKEGEEEGEGGEGCHSYVNDITKFFPA